MASFETLLLYILLEKNICRTVIFTVGSEGVWGGIASLRKRNSFIFEESLIDKVEGLASNWDDIIGTE
jgi:hypothetical protein